MADVLKRDVWGKCRQSVTSSGRYEQGNEGQRVQVSKDKRQMQIMRRTKQYRVVASVNEWGKAKASGNSHRSETSVMKAHKRARRRNSTDVRRMNAGRTMLREETKFPAVFIALL